MQKKTAVEIMFELSFSYLSICPTYKLAMVYLVLDEDFDLILLMWCQCQMCQKLIFVPFMWLELMCVCILCITRNVLYQDA